MKTVRTITENVRVGSSFLCKGQNLHVEGIYNSRIILKDENGKSTKFEIHGENIVGTGDNITMIAPCNLVELELFQYNFKQQKP